jgi:Protein of unknown function (DUF2442)
MPRVVEVAPLSQYRLHVEFDDGVAGTIDLSGELDGEVFQPLRDEAVFREVTVDESARYAGQTAPTSRPTPCTASLSESRRLSPDHSRRAPNATPPRNRQEPAKPGQLPARQRGSGPRSSPRQQPQLGSG